MFKWRWRKLRRKPSGTKDGGTATITDVGRTDRREAKDAKEEKEIEVEERKRKGKEGM